MAHAFARTVGGFALRARCARPRRVGKFPGVDQDRRRVVPGDASARSRPASSMPARTSARSSRRSSCRGSRCTGDGRRRSSRPARSGFVWLIAWLSLYRRAGGAPAGVSARSCVHPQRSGGAQRRMPWLGPLAALSADVGVLVGKFMTDPIWWFYLFWLPKFLDAALRHQAHGLAAPLIVIYLLADVGSVVGGWMSSCVHQARLVGERRRARSRCSWRRCSSCRRCSRPRATSMWMAVAIVERRGRRAPVVVVQPLHAAERHVPAAGGRLGRRHRRLRRRDGRVLFQRATGRLLDAPTGELRADFHDLWHGVPACARGSPAGAALRCAGVRPRRKVRDHVPFASYLFFRYDRRGEGEGGEGA